MALPPEKIRDCLLRPEKVYQSRKFHNIHHYAHGSVSCCVDVEISQVVTVLWLDDESWFADLSRGEYGGREYRGSKTA